MSMRDKYKPGPGWAHLAGPVYENKDGTRIHMIGLCRLPDGTFFNSWWDYSRYINIAGGNRKRGLMAWAKSKEDAGIEI